ncbi:DUF4258 domain-containing protein [Brevibacillus laterosporus]|uniref:DUF4258 domain-containing protein n=1 Tax=Brevibacillus laterosporus TaxID=1465 RepID=UPI003D194928
MSVSLKKHISQMTSKEQGRLLNLAMAVPYWKAVPHLKKRLKQRGGKLNHVRNIIFDGQLIEYHNKDGKNRILLRGVKEFRGKVMCAVFEIDTCKIITIYWNEVENTHEPINMRYYKKDLEIIKLLCN